MCKQSNKLKLCQCDLSKKMPENYWVLFKFTGEKPVQVIGVVVFPFWVDMKKHNEIGKFLLEAINKEDCFDQPITIRTNDILRIHLKRFHQQEFVFRYKHKLWEPAALGPFEIENFYEERKGGKVEWEMFTKED